MEKRDFRIERIRRVNRVELGFPGFDLFGKACGAFGTGLFIFRDGGNAPIIQDDSRQTGGFSI